MKAILYYTLVRSHRYSTAFRVLGVTSEAKYNRINGRWIDRDEPTHIRRDTMTGKFSTVDAAQSVIASISHVIKSNKPLIDAAHKAYALAQETEYAQIDAIVSAAVVP